MGMVGAQAEQLLAPERPAQASMAWSKNMVP
jgi:hypothetical protein